MLDPRDLLAAGGLMDYWIGSDDGDGSDVYAIVYGT